MGVAGAVVGGGLSIVNAYRQSVAQQQLAKAQAQQQEFNAQVGELQAEDAIRRGDKAAERHSKKVRQLIGSQRAALAAQGIEVNEGTALELQLQEADFGAEDVETIRNNAWREAFGFKSEALGARQQADLLRLGGASESRSTLITGGLQAAQFGAEGAGSFKSTFGSGNRVPKTKRKAV